MHTSRQKVLLVKKVPLKTHDSDDDEDIGDIDDMYYDSSYNDIDIAAANEKFVKFAATAEVREIAPAPRIIMPNKNRNRNVESIKSRLGFGK